MQFERQLQTNPDAIYNISQFSGFTVFPGVVYEKPYDSHWATRWGLFYRRLALEGDAEFEGSNLKSKFRLEQQFASAFAGVVHRPQHWKSSYLWIGGEYAHGLKNELTVLEGPAIDTSSIETKSFIVLSAAWGTEFRLTKKWLVAPELSAGIIINSEPVTVLAEGQFLLKHLL